MLPVVKKIRWQFYRAYLRMGSYVHMLHWRGHGVHSPFMYGIVRHVFMKRRVQGTDYALYGALRHARVNRHNSTLLQNLYTHCKMDSFTLLPGRDPSLSSAGSGRNLCILLPGALPRTMGELAGELALREASYVILSPHRTDLCWRTAQDIGQSYSCVSVDRRVMMIYFFDPKLQPQHYRI